MKYRWKVQDADRVMEDIGVHDEVFQKSEIWSARPEAVPKTPNADDGEIRIVESAHDGQLHWAAKFGPDEEERRRARLDYTIDTDRPASVLAQTETDIRGTVINCREERQQVLAEYFKAQDHQRRIRVRHKLNRPPRYSNNKFWIWFLAIVFVGVETLLNGPVMAPITDGGLYAGWSLSSLISLGNVLIGILSGLFLPRLWASRKVRALKRMFAGLAGMTSGGAVVSLNLAVSNVRTHGSLELTTDLTAFWNGDLLPQNLESFSLLLFGICVAIGTCLKFSTLHDAVPEYEDSDRAIQSLARRIEMLDEDAPQVLQYKADHGTSRLQEILTDSHIELVSYKKSLVSSEAAATAYENGCSRIVAVHLQCIERRRGDLKIASINTPDWWNDEHGQVNIEPPAIFDLEADRFALVNLEKDYKDVAASVASAELQIEFELRRARGSVELSSDTDLTKNGSVNGNVVNMQFRQPAPVYE